MYECNKKLMKNLKNIFVTLAMKCLMKIEIIEYVFVIRKFGCVYSVLMLVVDFYVTLRLKIITILLNLTVPKCINNSAS